MLHIADLTYAIGPRRLFDGASAAIAEGWTVGLVGRNGTGKSTLLKLIREGDEAIRIKAGARLGFVAQELPADATLLLDAVLAEDTERAALMAEAETATDPDRIGEIHARLLDIDAHSAEARASAILTGLGFRQSDLARATQEFSGGWRMRAALGGVLFSTPDLLLLDEPTNYLDLEGAAWLEAHLRKYPNTCIVVSHDREMLNRSVTHILALDAGKLEVCPGGYDLYLKRKAERASLAAAAKAKQDVQKAHLQAFVDRFRAKASKARQAQSRIKMLAKLKDIAVPIEERAIPFRFEADADLASPLVTLDEADLGYENGAPVLRGVSFRLDQDDRIVVIGPNGEGKTTLVKSIAGKLSLLNGRRVASKAMRIGYFSQDQMDELTPDLSVLGHIREVEPGWNQAQQRSLAARIGFGPQKVDTLAKDLSGGEKVRLLMGLMAHRKPHVLILDEPTSHLDIDSREALIWALGDYPGAVILITHDVFLAEGVADRLWLVQGGRARAYDGDLDDYRALVLAADRPNDRPGPGDAVAAATAADRGAPARPQGAARVNPQALKRKAADAEKAMHAAGARLAALDAALADPATYARDASAAGALARERAEVAERLAAAEELWLEASAALEGA
jgi:ATP-binding cassette subfamily F protein 3